MNFKKLLTYQANKFSKTTIAVRFNLLQVCPLVPSSICCVIYTFCQRFEQQFSCLTL